MKTKSAKAKGRVLQNWFRESLINIVGLDPQSVRCQIMGVGGEDIVIAPSVRKTQFPYAVECKNREKLNLWEAYEQASKNSGQWEPLLVVKRNRSRPLVILDAIKFLEIIKNGTPDVD